MPEPLAHGCLSTLSAAQLNCTVTPLQGNSEAGLSFLEGFGLNLSVVVRLGGHSIPRTHSNPAGPNVGFYIIKGVSSRLQEAPNVEIKTSTQV